MLTWEFMTTDIDFLMFSEFFWYVLLFWGFCRYMSHDHCSGGISMGLRTIGLPWGLLCCWTQHGKTVPSGASTWKFLQKSWRANDGCWWSNQLNTSMVLICQGFLNFCFFFFGETKPFGNLVIFSKKNPAFFGFLGVFRPGVWVLMGYQQDHSQLGDLRHWAIEAHPRRHRCHCQTSSLHQRSTNVPPRWVVLQGWNEKSCKFFNLEVFSELFGTTSL